MSDSFRRSERIDEKRKQNTDKCRTQVIQKSNQTTSETKRRHKSVCLKCGSEGRSSKKTIGSKLKIWFDERTQLSVKVCDICWKRLTRLKTITDGQSKSSIEDQKQRYLSNCQSFGLSLVQQLNDSSAERLYCPYLKTSGKACACLQRYVIGTDDNLEAKKSRAHHLLDLLRKAKQLSGQKCYSMSNPRSGQKIGLGNGHKKSKEFESFVLSQRTRLRSELNFCEKAIQRVLFYSNNFLHKKLRTEPNGRQRVDRQKGKSMTGKLVPIDRIADQMCCGNKCVRLAETHPQLLDEWRQRAVSGQHECRRVLAEMLTPTQGLRTNCCKFISLVTGSSLQTITKVNDHLITSGGNREPKDHGLKKSWIIDNNKQPNDTIQPLSQTSSAMEPLLRGQTSRLIRTAIESLGQTESGINQTNNEISVIAIVN